MPERMNVGIVGAAGRGGSFKDACEAGGLLHVHAVCDTNAEKIEEARATLGAREKYTDYADMLEKSDLQAVILGTPMPFHAPQAMEALRRSLHVLSEVSGGVSVEECRALVGRPRRRRAST